MTDFHITPFTECKCVDVKLKAVQLIHLEIISSLIIFYSFQDFISAVQRLKQDIYIKIQVQKYAHMTG